MKLTPKQEAFCLKYIELRNATQSAIQAGYSIKTAYSIGEENLRKPDIAQRLNELQGTIKEREDKTISDELERKRGLTVIERAPLKEPVTAKEKISAYHEHNLMDKVFEPERAIYQDIKVMIIRERRDNGQEGTDQVKGTALQGEESVTR